MKKFNYLIIFCLLLSVAFLSNCKKEKTKPTDNLAGTWGLGTVEKEGTAVTSEFTGFTITFSEGSKYSITNNGSTTVWPKTAGTYTWETKDVTIKRDDGTPITTGISGTNLTLTFKVKEEVVSTTAKALIVDKNYVFNLVKK